MAYGSGFDETPNYLNTTSTTQPPGALANLPSKLDPIPFCWFDQTLAGQGTASLGVNIVVGRATPLVAHNFIGSNTIIIPMSDITWRDTSGNTSIWFMNGINVTGTGSLGNVPTTWSIVGQRDFNGDGNADLLWRDTSGNTAIWFMNGATVVSSASLGNIPTSWTVVGTGDFNGDGHGDILWQDSAGDLAVWLMNGANVLSSGGHRQRPAERVDGGRHRRLQRRR